MDCELQIRFDNGRSETIPLNRDRLVLGRSRRADISCPKDSALSLEHMALQRLGEEWVVLDLGSLNGTFVNGVPLRGKRQLRPGDRIVAGHLVFLYERTASVGEAAEGPSEPAPSAPEADELVTLSVIENGMPLAPRISAAFPDFLPLSAAEKLQPLGLAWFQVLNGPYFGKSYDLKRDFSIGRDRKCDLILHDPGISRNHARILLQKSRSFVIYNLSKNGTLLNGFPLTDPQELRDRDEVRIGATRLRFKQAISPEDTTPQGKRRLRDFDPIWKRLEESARTKTRSSFTSAVLDLLYGPLRESVGYSVERDIPNFRGIAGCHVRAPVLGIRQSSFPILVMAYEPGNAELCADLRKLLEIEKVSEYLALLIVVPGIEGMVDEEQELRRQLTQGGELNVPTTQTSSVMPHDLIVLDQQHVASIVALGTSKRLIDIILAQGIELASVSPYVTAGPVPDGMFFGREREIKMIQNSLRDGNYAVVGGRRIGKSSILQRLERRLNAEPDKHFGRYHNCEGCFDSSDFLESMSDEFEIGIDRSNPLSFRKLALELQKRNPGRLIVFLLDEIDQLLTADSQPPRPGQLFKLLRSLSHQGKCRFIFSGSRCLYEHLNDPRSPFFNFCKYLTLRPLDKESVAEIVGAPLEQLGIELVQKAELIERIADLTSGHPNLTQRICDGLLRTIQVRRISLTDFEGVINGFEFLEHFVNTARGEATPLERLISLLMDASEFTVQDVAASLSIHGVNPREGIQASLEMMCLGMLLERRGDGYRFLLKHFPRIVRKCENVPEQIERLVAELYK